MIDAVQVHIDDATPYNAIQDCFDLFTDGYLIQKCLKQLKHCKHCKERLEHISRSHFQPSPSDAWEVLPAFITPLFKNYKLNVPKILLVEGGKLFRAVAVVKKLTKPCADGKGSSTIAYVTYRNHRGKWDRYQDGKLTHLDNDYQGKIQFSSLLFSPSCTHFVYYRLLARDTWFDMRTLTHTFLLPHSF